ncbi:TRAP transporter small permease [Oceanisphaera sp. IT1-181]|uniref:TRAP transporter small permease n=1 Tax=Oceanisphaera sp. IT1-181 TaxID=3081199 RepID=UPI0029C9E701|nr:TRAP transporter small permease [Oceanisphaera sp. IT1-181]
MPRTLTQGAATAAPYQTQETRMPVLLTSLKTWLERGLEVFTIGLLLALTTIVLAAVFYRAFGSSLIWYDEVASIGLAWLSFYGACLATLKRAHMGFPGLITAAPVVLRSLLFALSEIIVIGFFAIMAWFGYQVLEVLAWDRMVSLPGITMDMTQSVIPISAALFIICELISMPGAWQKMRSGIDPEHEAIDDAIRQAEEDLKESKS